MFKNVIGRPLTIDEQLFRPINGAAYVRDDQDGSLIFYATQEGIVQENLRTQKRDVFNKTKGVVNADTALRLYQDGMLAIGDGKVILRHTLALIYPLFPHYYTYGHQKCPY